MNYMLQTRFNGAQAQLAELPEPEQQAIFAEYMAIRQAPGVLDANQLHVLTASQ
jgi:hypothetical protein